MRPTIRSSVCALALTFAAAAADAQHVSPWDSALRAARPSGAEALPADSNAWPFVEAALREYFRAQASLRVPGPDGTPVSPVLNAALYILPASNEATAHVQALIERSAAALESTALPGLIDSAVAAPLCEQSPSDGWMTVLVRSGITAGPDAALSEIAQWQIIRFVIASRAADAPTALKHLRAAARIVWIYEQGPMARRLLGSSVADQLGLAVREEIMARRVSPREASAYLQAIDAARPPTPWSLTTSLERVQMESLAWGIARQAGLDAEGIFVRAIEACGLHERDDLGEIVPRATAAERLDPIVHTLSRALASYAPLRRAQRRAAVEYIDPRSLSDLLPCDPYCVARFMSESWSWIDAWLEQIDAHESRFQATRLMLALEASRPSADAAYPPSLTELVPSHLASLPTDPVSGTGYGYRRTTDPDTDTYRRPYLLWSIGADEDNDDAREPVAPQELPRVLVPGQAPPPDADWVMNVPGRP